MDWKVLALANMNGSEASLTDLNATENGTYTHEGYDGYDEVVVNVPNPSTGKVNITNMNEVDVTNYAAAQVVDADLVAGNIKKDVEILGITGTLETGITPTGSISITSNGNHDVTNYATAAVNVPTELPDEYITFTPITGTTKYNAEVHSNRQSLLVSFDGSVNLQTVLLPNTLRTLNDNLFKSSGITSIELPNSLTTIGSNCFNSTTNLTSITIPNSVTTLGSSIFRGSGLTSFVCPSSWTSIPNSLCAYCENLTSLTIPEGITIINENAFERCRGLTSVSLPNSLTTIEAHAFSGTTGIHSFIIPSNVTTIKSYAFGNNPQVYSVTFLGTPTTLNRYCFSSDVYLTDIYVPWAEGAIEGAPWGATNATIHYNTIPTE